MALTSHPSDGVEAAGGDGRGANEPQLVSAKRPLRQSSGSPGSPAPAKSSETSVLAVSVDVTLRFVLTGLIALFTGVAWLGCCPDILATYHYNQYVIALTHLFTLGWITSLIMGSMYQLVPVALEVRLHSERLARWQFAFHLLGFAGMVWMFWIWNVKQAGHFGSAVALGVGLFVYNIGRTLKSIPRWNIIAAAIASALVWLSLTILAGLYLAAAKCWAFSPFVPLAQMHAHAHLGVVGFFIMMIIGVSFRLVPMFALTDVQQPRRAAWAVGLLNAGLLGLVIAILGQSAWKPVPALVIVAGLTAYGWEMTAMLRARKRRGLDGGLIYFLTGVGLLAVPGALGLALAWPTLPLTPFTGQLENVYGFVALLGSVTLAMLGMLYKIVPFLVWYSRYSPEVGRRKVPALADLYSRPLQAVGYWLYLAGLLAVSVSTAWGYAPGVRWSCALLLAGLTVFLVNMGHILRHLIRPATAPSIQPT